MSNQSIYIGALKSLMNLTTTRPVAASTPLQENNLPVNHLQLLTFNSRLFFIKRKGSGETKRMEKNTFVPKTQIVEQPYKYKGTRFL